MLASTFSGPLAQLARAPDDAQGVGGSNPSRPTNAKENNTDCRWGNCNNDDSCSCDPIIYLIKASRHHTSLWRPGSLLLC